MVSQPPGNIAGMAPGGHIPMGPHQRAGGPPHNIPMGLHSGAGHNIPIVPHSRAEGMPMDPHSGGSMAPDLQMRPGGLVSGAQLGGVRPVPVSRPVVSSVHTEPIPPPRADGSNWVAPGDVVNTSRPEVACPLCGRNDFATQTDLEIHCAQCT